MQAADQLEAAQRLACSRWLAVAAFGQTLAGAAVAAAGPPGPTRPLLWAGRCLVVGAFALAGSSVGQARKAQAEPVDLARALAAAAVAGAAALAAVLAPLGASGDLTALLAAAAAPVAGGFLCALPLTVVAWRRFPAAT